jgi:putative transposase
MPHLLSSLLTHIDISTKDRAPVLDKSMRTALHASPAAVALNVNCECLRVGGVADHVHHAVRVARTIAMAELVEQLKSSSSNWLNSLLIY